MIGWLQATTFALGEPAWLVSDLADHEYLAETTAERGAFLMRIGQGARAVALVTANIASYLPFPGASLAGDLALVALGEKTMAEAMVGAAIGLIPGGKLMGKVFGKLGGFIGRIGSAAWGLAKEYAGKVGSFLWRNHPMNLIARGAQWLAKACGCFEQGTEVWTASGLVPIEQVQPGDFVMAFDEDRGETDFREVKRTFVRRAAPILSIVLSLPTGQALALNTTEEHPFRAAASEQWVEAGALQPGEIVETAEGVAVVESVAHTGRTSTVYNFEVEGLHSYYVSPDGVLVHNGICNLWEWGRNLTDHVLQSGHNWETLFGGAKPEWSRVKEILETAANTGIEGVPTIIRGAGGQQIGTQVEKVLIVNGRSVVAKLSLLEGSQKWILKDGWVR